MSKYLDHNSIREKLDKIYKEHEEELSEIGLDRDDINCFAWDFKTYHGLTETNTEEPNGKEVKGKYCIRISKYKKDGSWEDTLRHELAHVANHKDIGKKSKKEIHGTNWKHWARKLGADPSACKKQRPGSVKGDYMVGCPNECFKVTRHRYTTRVRLPEKYTCSECGNPLASWNTGDERPDSYGCHSEKTT